MNKHYVLRAFVACVVLSMHVFMFAKTTESMSDSKESEQSLLVLAQENKRGGLQLASQLLPITAITPADFNKNAGAGKALYTINNPGHYYLTHSVSIDPQFDNMVAIIVASSNVVLDLNGATLTRLSSNTATGIGGIIIQNGLSNIEITNGTLSNLNGGGIEILDLCREITFSDLNISSCQPAGMGVVGTSTGGIDSLTMERVYITNCTDGALGLPLALGAIFNFCTHASIENCKFNNNRASIAGNQAYGLVLNNCTNVNVENSQACGNSGSVNATGEGFRAAAGIANRFTACTANFNSTTGFVLASSENGSIIEKCTALSNGSSANLLLPAYGISLESGGGAYVVNCIVRKNFLANNMSPAGSYGYSDQNSAGTTTLLEGNVSFGQGAVNPTASTQIVVSAPNNQQVNYSYTLGTLSNGDVTTMIQEENIASVNAFNNVSPEGDFAGSYVNLSITTS